MPASNCLTPPGDSNVQVNITVGNGAADVCSSGNGERACRRPGPHDHVVAYSHHQLQPALRVVVLVPTRRSGRPGRRDGRRVRSEPRLHNRQHDGRLVGPRPDGCCLAAPVRHRRSHCAFGGGGGGPFVETGTCINLAGVNVAGPDVTTVAAGAIGSNGSPLYDLPSRPLYRMRSPARPGGDGDLSRRADRQLLGPGDALHRPSAGASPGHRKGCTRGRVCASAHAHVGDDTDEKVATQSEPRAGERFQPAAVAPRVRP